MKLGTVLLAGVGMYWLATRNKGGSLATGSDNLGSLAVVDTRVLPLDDGTQTHVSLIRSFPEGGPAQCFLVSLPAPEAAARLAELPSWVASGYAVETDCVESLDHLYGPDAGATLSVVAGGRMAADGSFAALAVTPDEWGLVLSTPASVGGFSSLEAIREVGLDIPSSGPISDIGPSIDAAGGVNEFFAQEGPVVWAWYDEAAILDAVAFAGSADDAQTADVAESAPAPQAPIPSYVPPTSSATTARPKVAVVNKFKPGTASDEVAHTQAQQETRAADAAVAARDSVQGESPFNVNMSGPFMGGGKMR